MGMYFEVDISRYEGVIMQEYSNAMMKKAEVKERLADHDSEFFTKERSILGRSSVSLVEGKVSEALEPYFWFYYGSIRPLPTFEVLKSLRTAIAVGHTKVTVDHNGYDTLMDLVGEKN